MPKRTQDNEVEQPTEVEGGAATATAGDAEGEGTDQTGAAEGFYFVDYSLAKRNDVPERFRGLKVRIPLVKRTADAAALFTRILQQAGADPSSFKVTVEGEIPTASLHAIADNHNGRYRLQAQKATVDHANATETQGEGENAVEVPIATEESVVAFPLNYTLVPSERLVGGTGTSAKALAEKGRKLADVESRKDSLSPEERALYEKLFG
jgi:hypothetical protein